MKRSTDNTEKFENPTKPILVMGHSHGGNVGIEVINNLVEQFQGLIESGKLEKMPEIQLVLVNTPVHPDEHQLSKKAKIFVNVVQVDSKNDVVAGLESSLLKKYHPQEFYNDVKQVEYTDQTNEFPINLGNHMGTWDINSKIWLPEVDQKLKTEKSKVKLVFPNK